MSGCIVAHIPFLALVPHCARGTYTHIKEQQHSACHMHGQQPTCRIAQHRPPTVGGWFLPQNSKKCVTPAA